MDTHDFGNAAIGARVKAAGAELCSLRFAAGPEEGGREMLWQAGPAWPRHAPVLFPIVGRLAHDTLHHEGFAGRLTQHGFARDRVFSFVERRPDGCTLALADDAATRAAYPFPFRLLLDYAVAGPTLVIGFRVENTGETVLPASVGAHPAFRWPLAPGIPKEAHRLVFATDENGPVRALEGGLLLPDPVETPIAGRVLALSDAVFAGDAVILQSPSSRAVRYEAPGTGAPAISVAWEGFSTLGIWSKPADFVCIEPWTGYASPRDFEGEFTDKPGVALIPPGETLVCNMRVTLHDPSA